MNVCKTHVILMQLARIKTVLMTVNVKMDFLKMERTVVVSTALSQVHPWSLILVCEKP